MNTALGDLAGVSGHASPAPMPAPSPPGDGVRLSVVVPTCGRPLLLLRCLQALYAQSLPAESFEILVVDDGHDDATRRVVITLAEEHETPRLRYLRPEQPRGGPAAARNLGWHSAHGEIVAFTDDDTVPLDDWLAQGESAMRAGPWAAVAGRVMVPLGPEPPTDHARMTQGLERTEFVTANAFVRRRALQQVKGFDERFTRAWREDSDLQFRLQDSAGPVGRCESAVVVHPVRGERWGVSLRQQRNGFFEALLYAKHPRRYRAQGGVPTPWDFYLIVALAASTPVLALLDITGSAVVSGLLCLALILRFVARRLKGTSHRSDHVLEMLVTSALIPFLAVWWRLRGAWHFRVLFF
jgi:cellulose synthase/poly-beta-1,6-N-acetylglucosamine synthase-like glycosyltransferase